MSVYTTACPLTCRCFPVINSSGVHLGKLCVHISIKASTQSRREVPPQKKVTLDVPEFIVGPGQSWEKQQKTRSGLYKMSNEDVSALVRERDQMEKDQMSPCGVKAPQVVTGGSEEERGEGGGSGPWRAELGTQQMKVISDLIERGEKLRNMMVESILTRGIEDGVPPVERKER